MPQIDIFIDIGVKMKPKKQKIRNFPLFPLLLLAGFVFWGCSGSSGGGGGDVDGSVTDDGHAQNDADGLVDGEIGDDSSVCEGTLCGNPAKCCSPEEECIDGRCLPLCSSGVRCGSDNETCCSEGQVCISGLCATPGNICSDSFDCDQPGEFCEPTLGLCLPQPDPLTCEVVPDFDDLEVTLSWSYEEHQIISIPVVADIDGSGVPDVVVNTTRRDGLGWPGGNIVVLSGEDGSVKLEIPHDPENGMYGSHGRSTIAIGDVSGDGLPDIIYASRPVGGRSVITAVDHTGTLLWRSQDSNGLEYGLNVVNGAATLANFDDDPEAEVIFGATLIDNDGLVVWDEGGGGGGASYGSNSSYTGGISAVADLDGDGIPEIVSGRHAWTVDWQPPDTPGDPPNVNVTNFWTYEGPDGYPAVADMDLDGVPEVVLVGSSQIQVLNGQTGALWCGIDPTDALCAADPSLRTQPLPIPGGSSSNRGGAPTVADFDGDGRPEIGVAGGYYYTVYDINRPGELIFQPEEDLPPEEGAIFVRWSKETQDLSSNATGSSVYDFQGDGAAEVVYNDECYMRVYSGVDGHVQLEIPNSTSTIVEYPLVVDVDGNGRSEILVVANQMSCDGLTPRQGLYVYEDAHAGWVPTRKVWTQHAYHVTNATSSGNVPLLEENNWTMPGLNNYRQNVQGNGVFNAPDLAIDLSVGLQQCNLNQIVLTARVSNVGALGVFPGAPVEFYLGTDQNGEYLGLVNTTEPLLPGASTVVTLAVDAPEEPADYYAVVNRHGTATTVDECDNSNNEDYTTGVYCDFVQ